MGQVFRMMTYDYGGSRRNAIAALQLAKHNLKWYRLDDGVMGGMSSTQHQATNPTEVDKNRATTNNMISALHFSGTINTEGGGFCSVRSDFPSGLLTQQHSAIKIRYRGDGKTYKVLLSDGRGGGPMSQTPSWQIDLPTANTCSDGENQWDEVVLP